MGIGLIMRTSRFFNMEISVFFFLGIATYVQAVETSLFLTSPRGLHVHNEAAPFSAKRIATQPQCDTEVCEILYSGKFSEAHNFHVFRRLASDCKKIKLTKCFFQSVV